MSGCTGRLHVPRHTPRYGAPVEPWNTFVEGDNLDVVPRLAPAYGPFDVVYLDPPYPMPADEVVAALTALVAHGWVQPGGAVVVERSARSVEPRWPDGLVLRRTKRYGETVLWYLRRDSGTDPDALGGGSPAAV